MRIVKSLIFSLIFVIPFNTFASNITRVPSTDRLADGQITSYYDLRDRKTYIQVTNIRVLVKMDQLQYTFKYSSMIGIVMSSTFLMN